MDLSKAPPICQKRTLAFVNHFIITTVSFLNKLLISCESKLQKLDERMQKLEASLCILEAKLSSIPGLEVEASTVTETQTEKPAPKEEPEIEETPVLSIEIETPADSKGEGTPNVPSDVPEDVAPKEENPLLAKYKKMVYFGVPVPAVKLKMQQEGVDPALLDK
ncbi:unnamed protein product [Bemisia tabaci]|uniref:WASH complex subunit CCDC53 n=1 Tax=Bemisia tabaci TaxID=7038 RepID=A0A9P0ALE5_BEMTA|nr:unnamed protein product [Bemisia tabaci]